MDPLTPQTVVVFRRRWFRVMLTTFLVAAAFGAVETESDFLGITTGQWILLSLGLLAVFFVVYQLNWRCPDCGEAPSDHWRPLYCGHCGAPLLNAWGSRSGAPRVSREEWERQEVEWYRQSELAWAGKRSVGLVVVAVGVFFFGIVLGIGGQAGQGRLAGIGIAVFLLFLGGLLVRWIRRGFEAAGVPPERAERGVWGMVGVSALVMIFLGIGGLLYVVSPFDPTPIRWELRLEALDHAEALAIGSGVYALAGILLLAWSWRAWRGGGS